MSQPLERILVPNLLSALKHQVDSLSQHVREHSSKRAVAAELINLPFLPLDLNYCMKLQAKFSSKRASYLSVSNNFRRKTSVLLWLRAEVSFRNLFTLLQIKNGCERIHTYLVREQLDFEAFPLPSVNLAANIFYWPRTELSFALWVLAQVLRNFRRAIANKREKKS